jgi:hypothetical protein
MTFTPRRGSVNQSLQFGIETTPGTAVPANKRIDALSLVMGIKGTFKSTAGTGRKYASVQQLNSEWTEASFTGSLDYNAMTYILAGAMGIATPAAHGTSATAKDWVYDAILSGPRQPQTYSIEQGEAATRAQKFAYGLINTFGYKITRQDASVTGNLLAQQVSDGITMTASPTAVSLLPMVGQQFNVYLDPTSANLGVTQLTEFLSVDFSMGNIYGPFWPINRANASYLAHVDLKPSISCKLMTEADSVGMALLTSMRSGSTQFLRVNGQGPVIDNNQTVTIGGGATTGNFTLTYKGQTTANIAYSAALTAATVQTAYQLLSTVGAACTVSGPNGGPYVFTYIGTLATDTTAMTATNVSLTGGTPTIIVTQTQAYDAFTHDMAIKIGQPSTWQDSNGIYAIEWTCEVFEDATWGHSHTATMTNLLSAL